MCRLLEIDAQPTAVFVANNLMTMGALHALRERRVCVPDEISIIGFDDLEFAELVNPPLTVIARDARLQGSQAMELMIKHLSNGEQPHQSIQWSMYNLLREDRARFPGNRRRSAPTR